MYRFADGIEDFVGLREVGFSEVCVSVEVFLALDFFAFLPGGGILPSSTSSFRFLFFMDVPFVAEEASFPNHDDEFSSSLMSSGIDFVSSSSVAIRPVPPFVAFFSRKASAFCFRFDSFPADICKLRVGGRLQ